MVLALKVDKKSANKVLKELYKKNLVDKNFKIKNDENFVYIPLKEKIEGFEILEVNEDFFKKRKNEENIKLYVKSFDLIGDIAITIIPKGLEDKKKEIGEAIAKISKAKTVLAEKEGRKGEFRLQEFELIYGEDKRETIYKENNVKMFVNVEKVYFSPRLATDRLELAKEIKENENVLVMFAGIMPYPLVISKNSKANLIIGIEKNPNAFYYSKENLKLNKTTNVISFIGDVKEVLPLTKSLVIKETPKIEEVKGLNYYVFENNKVISPVNLNKKLGIKTSLNKEEAKNKIEGIKENINNIGKLVIEIYLNNWEELDKLEEFKDYIRSLINKEIIWIVHQPYKDDLKEKIDKINFNLFDYFVIHPSIIDYKKEKIIYYFNNVNEIIEFLKNKPYKDKILVENVYFKPLNSKDEILKLIRNKINVCFDFSHYIITLLTKYNKEEASKIFIEDFKELFFEAKKEKVTFYCHISNFPLEAHKVDEGFIEMDKVLPFVEFGIFEVKSKNEIEGKEMIESFNYSFKELKFDRIIMPLPKGSEKFLDLAFKNIKKGGIINWYQFCKEEEIEQLVNLAKEEAKKQGLNLKVLNIKKVGQIGPRTYRIRIDLKVLN